MVQVRQTAGWISWLDRRPAAVLLLLAGLYAWLVQRPLHNGLWYDELHTYYIAQAPTTSAMLDDIRHVDLNPPLLYFLVRTSHAILGPTNAATRLPSAVAFFGACALLLLFLSRAVGALWAAGAVVLLWFSPFFRYATEARPYALLLVFFSVVLLGWSTAISSTGTARKWAIAGVFAGSLGMVMSHVLAPFSILPFCVAELVRAYRLRKMDWPLWASLLIPLSGLVLVFGQVQQVQAATYPTVFRASFKKIFSFYAQTIELVLPALLAALLIAFPIALRQPKLSERPVFLKFGVPVFATALLTPVLLNLAMMRSGGPFWDRYCITSAFVIYAAITLFIAHECRLNRYAALAALIALSVCCIAREVYVFKVEARSVSAHDAALDQIRPDLPFVVNAATVFLALDHGENAAFLNRVYYLVDRPSALRYAHTDIFEGVSKLVRYFPIRAHVEPYQSFAAEHRHFIVFGTPEDDDHWLLKKLIAEGAKVDKIGEFDTSYEDSLVFEVTLPQVSNR